MKSGIDTVQQGFQQWWPCIRRGWEKGKKRFHGSLEPYATQVVDKKIASKTEETRVERLR